MRPVCAALVLASLLPAVARADEEDKRACMKAYVDTQSLRADEKLRAAHDAALECARAACPTVLRNDCVAWARDLERVTPTAVFSVVDPDGRDRADATVTVDGSIAARLDGGTTSLDPGEHVVRCELAGEAPLETRVILHEGEHDRPVRCAFPPRPTPQAQAAGSPGEGASSQHAAARPVPASVYVLGGAGVVALGVWGWFGGSALLWGDPSVPTLHRCQPNCSPSDRDDVHTKLVVADVAGGTALVALGAAAVLYFTRAPVVVPTPGGAVAAWAAEF